MTPHTSRLRSDGTTFPPVTPDPPPPPGYVDPIPALEAALGEETTADGTAAEDDVGPDQNPPPDGEPGSDGQPGDDAAPT